MKSSLLLLMFVSLPAVAAETNYDALLNRNAIYDPTRIIPYEGSFTGRTTVSTPMLTIPLVSKGRFSFFGAVDQGIGGWNKKTRTLWLSDQLAIGPVKNGSLGRGVGFKYNVSPNMTVWTAGVRIRDTGHTPFGETGHSTVFMLGFNLVF